MSGTEGVHHFLQVPQIITKSMEYHYPAEFIVPTNVPFDVGPIGYTFETEFEHQETPVGLQSRDMLRGILVTGGTATQRFITNFRIVYEAAMAEKNYLVITTSKQWRRLLDLVEDATLYRLGSDLTLNIIDAEEVEINNYAVIMAQAFAQVFHLSRASMESILQTFITLLERNNSSIIGDLIGALENKASKHQNINKELKMVHQFLQNIGHGAASYILGSTLVPFSQLLRGITIIEIDLKSHQQVQFFTVCLLAKILAHAQRHPNGIVLVDTADLLSPFSPNYFKTNEADQYLLEWVKQLNLYGIGLHLSLHTPSRFPQVVLHSFPTIIALQTSAYKDVIIVRDLLKFLPDRMVHSNFRHDNYQIEFLKTIPENTFILKREDIPNAFPVQGVPIDFANTHIWTDHEIRQRLTHLIPTWTEPVHVAQTVIEQDFGSETLIIEKILSLLEEYPALGKQGLFSSLNSQQNIDLDMVQCDRILTKMQDYNYIAVNEHNDGRGHRHYTYRLTEKGRLVFQRYLENSRDLALERS